MGNRGLCWEAVGGNVCGITVGVDDGLPLPQRMAAAQVSSPVLWLIQTPLPPEAV